MRGHLAIPVAWRIALTAMESSALRRGLATIGTPTGTITIATSGATSGAATGTALGLVLAVTADDRPLNFRPPLTRSAHSCLAWFFYTRNAYYAAVLFDPLGLNTPFSLDLVELNSLPTLLKPTGNIPVTFAAKYDVDSPTAATAAIGEVTTAPVVFAT